MTVFEASVKLYAWFNEHDSFCLDTDESELMGNAKRKKFQKEEEISAISCALNELKNLNLIDHAEVNDKKIWVLKKSFDTLSQTVELTPETCLSISTLVNGFCDVIDNTADKVDPKDITEKDVKNLLFVAAYLMDERNKY